MSAEKWSRVWGHPPWTPGKEDMESREHLANFLDALKCEAENGSLFKLGHFSVKRGVLPNGYSFDFIIRQGVTPGERHEWSEPKPSDSITERNIRRCIHCRRAFAKRIENNRCRARCEQ